MERILLVLQRSAEQESALRKLLEQQQIRSSPKYHMWLTPEQFGQQFGPADADIQAVTDWLTSQGFQLNRVGAGRTVIEFSGTAGAVRQALHTEIHKYVVRGEEHWANASDPQIPAALGPVVAGFASLNNFPRKPPVERVGAFSRTKATGEVKPLLTVPTGNGVNYYVLVPGDFATIYNVWPLWQASPAINGAGQTVAIVAASNINVQDVSDFRNLFGLPDNPPQIVLDGPDPGVSGTAWETEADLDTEWSGAVATNATIDLVVSESTEASFGADLSALYVIDNNLAPILSVSVLSCEASLGAGGNAFYNSLWEQGSAQGITVVVAAGDNGSAGCDYSEYESAAEYGLAVSGLASTPFNVAMGGTDFNDVNNWSTYWSSVNNATTLASAASYIPEMAWNDSCARSGVASDCASAGTDTPAGIDLVAGSGGASNCAQSISTSTSINCTAGYPKPAWQSGPGVPGDNARDLPDVSLFAGDGTIANSFYLICEADALPAGEVSCNSSSAQWYFEGAGGTSAAAPAFAGIMALVNQKTGERQGNANYVLYPLAAGSGSSCTSNASMAATADSSSCVFYDVVTGNNSVACVGGSPNCSNPGSGYGLLEVNPPSNTAPAWTTTAGYDLATGLGSVNAANLVRYWTSVSFKPTTTNLASLSPTTLTHGQPASFTINVAGSGGGTPWGDVSLIAQAGASVSNSTGIGPFALSGGSVSNKTTMLPGGTYGVTAHYAGNGTYGASDSTPPVQVTVNPEGSQTHVALLTFDPITGQEISSNATSVVYGSTFNLLRVDVTNSSGQDCFSVPYGCPSGQVTLTDNGLPLDEGTYKLNSQGYTEDQSVQLIYGVNNIGASYSGDNSYNTSTSVTDAITYNKAPTTVTLSGLPANAVTATPVSLTATINTQSYGIAPTGAVQMLLGGVPVGSWGGNGTPTNGSASGFASLQIPLNLDLTAGVDSLTAQYAGDNNYAGSTSAPATVTVGDYSLSASPSTINISAPGQSGTSAITIGSLYGFSGSVSLTCGASAPGVTCAISPSSVNVTAASPPTATLTVNTTAPAGATLPALQPRARPGGMLRGQASLPADGSFQGAARLQDKRESRRSRAGILGARPSPPPGTTSSARGLQLPAGLRLPVGLPWFLAGLLALAMLASLAKERRRAGLAFATAMLVVGIWAACGGGGGGSSPPPPAAPIVSLSATNLAFGQENMGSTSAAQTVTLSNTGNASLSISSMALGGANSVDFAQTSNCGASVAAGANCTISVTFTPSAAGARNASLAITDNATGSPQTVSLSGTGLQPAVSLSPSSLTFAKQTTGTASAGQGVTLKDTGNASLKISSIALSGANPGDFAQTNNCGSSLGAGASCTISIAFAPTAAGSRSASLEISDDASGSPQTVSLSGTGLAPTTTLSLSTTSLAFGQENETLTTAPQTVTLSNTGSASLSISSITVSGADPSDFPETNNCGASVAVGANCTISVSFAPTIMGALTSQLLIADNASGSPQLVSLSGTGINAPTGPASYQITVNGTSGGDLHTMFVTVNVQ